MISWDIRNKFLLLALLPSIAISVCLGGYLSYARLLDLENFLNSRGNTTTQQLSTISQYAINMDNKALQQAIANATLEEKDVRAVTLYDARQRPLIHAGPRMFKATSQVTPQIMPPEASQETKNHNVNQATKTNPLPILFDASQSSRSTAESIRFYAPVRSGNLISSTYLANPNPNPNSNTNTSIIDSSGQIIGWVEVEYFKNTFALKRYQTIFVTTIMIILVLMLTGILTLRISSQMENALQVLIDGVMRIKNGDLSSQIELQEKGGLNHLASEINEMSHAIKSSTDEMQYNVEQTTSDLRETLETIEIQNIELDLARKEAVEGSRIKSEFLANTSHEIRTPLNGIIGFTNLLLRSKLTPAQKDYLDTIQNSSEGLLTIINDILDFSKIEAGKLILDYVPINLREIIEDVLTMLAPSANDKQLELILLIYAEVPTNLIGDPLRIKQIITNLVSNAIKFTQQGNIIVRVNLESIRDNNVNITISITDTGIGLSPNQQRNIFDAFTQGNTATSREYGGTGLGLVISKRLVEQMGGDISLKSEQGMGSTFTFSIKAKLANSKEESRYQALADKHIVLLEANPVLQLSLQHLLQNWQCVVHAIEAGTELTEDLMQRITSNENIDAVIVGLSPTEKSEHNDHRIELLSKFYNCPIVVMSPNSYNAPNTKNHSTGTSNKIGTLNKPVSQRKLYDSLCRSLQPAHQKSSAPMTSSQKLIPTLSTTNRPRILAVDDNEANLKLLSVLLQDIGAEVVEATSGIKALLEVERTSFDLILMDIQMPDLDGITTSERIRAMPTEIANTPIIALTAHAMAEERQKLLETGLNDHLTKPINEVQLYQIIQRWCPGFFDTPVLVENQDSQAALQLNNEADPIAITAIKKTKNIYNHPVDLQLCLKLANNKADLARDMLSMLLAKISEDLQSIDKAYTSKDEDAFLERVHRLHGATSYTGASMIKQVSEQLETAIKSKNQAQVERSYAALHVAIDELLEWSNEHDIDSLFGG